MSGGIGAQSAVLVIDDDVTLLKMAEEILKEFYTVSLAKSGEQALRLLRKGFFPDVILLDIDMPGMDGYETIHRLREIVDIGDVPVIYLTGLTQPEHEIRGLRSGAVDYISKPFVREVLLERIRVHLKTGGQRRQLRALQKSKLRSEMDAVKFERASAALTATERNVARLIALGYTNQEVGDELGYSYHYVKKLASIIFEKLGIANRDALRELVSGQENPAGQ